MKLIPERDFPELQRDPKSGVWYVRKFIAGKGEIMRSTRERFDKKKAKAIAFQILSEFSLDGLKKYDPTWMDIALIILKQKEHLDPDTYKSAKNHLFNHLAPYFRDKRISEITPADWKAYVLKENAKTVNMPGKKPFKRKLFNDCKHMRMVMSYAFDSGLIEKRMVIKNPDKKTAAGKVFTDEECKRLIECASDKLKIQVLMGLTMGMRKTEILTLEWSDIDFDNLTISLKAEKVKTRAARTVAISDPVLSLLKSISRCPHECQWVFCSREGKSAQRSNKTAWKACKRRANVRGRFHDLRHTFITNAIFKYGHKIAAVSAYVGASISVIEKTYSHPSHEQTKHVAAPFGECRGVGEE